MIQLCAYHVRAITDNIGVPIHCFAMAMTYLQRFFMLESMIGHDIPRVAGACILLAGKVNQSRGLCREIVSETMKMRASGLANRGQGTEVFKWSREFEVEKAALLDAEHQVICVLNHNFHVELPYGPLIKVCRI